MIYIGKIQVKNMSRGPSYESTYRTICYDVDFENIRQKLIEYRKAPVNRPSDIWGKDKRWGKIRIECFKEGTEVSFPYEAKEVLIIQ